MTTNRGNRVAIVTGAAQGIGKEVAFALSARGAAVSCWDIQGDLVRETASEVERRGGTALGFETDVTDARQVARSTQETVGVVGQVDILVNVAGGTLGAAPGIDGITEEEWDRVVNLNMRAPFLTCKAVAGMMQQGFAPKVGFPTHF